MKLHPGASRQVDSVVKKASPKEQAVEWWERETRSAGAMVGQGVCGRGQWKGNAWGSFL